MRDALAERPIPPRLLGALLMLLAALVAPHAANLSPPVLAFFYLATLWRLLVQRRPLLMPRRWMLIPLMLVALVVVVWTTGFDDGRLTGTALLVVMLGLKLLELRTRRDMHFALFLGYFLILTQFLYNQALWLAAPLFFGMAALIVIQTGLNRARVDLGGQLRDALGMLAGALPLALVVFLLFPRLQSPLWAVSTSSTLTGISGEMNLGDIGELSRSSETAFRVRFSGAAPTPEQRYWRGPVLWQTDGRKWTSVPRAVHSEAATLPSATPIEYEVTLEPTGERWLFGLDIVSDPPAGARLDQNFALVADERVDKRLSYRAASNPDFRMLTLSAQERQLGLALPGRVSSRLTELIADWRADADPQQPLQLVRKALSYFREQPFVYTLSPGNPAAEDPIDHFLFESRRGFCEHYAGSFALMMRVADIPSRVVVGYLGGERNPHAEHWVIRQSDAHAWVEVWIPSLGWWRVDPTAAVAPERVEQPINPALSLEADQIVFRVAGEGGLLAGAWKNVIWVADAMDVGWHRWVLGFSAERQSSLLARFGLSGLRGFGLALALLVGGTLAAGFVYLMARLPKPRTHDPLPMVWQRFVHKLQRADLAIAPWHGPDTLCGIASARYPGAAQQLDVIARMYVQLRYGRRQDPRLLGALRRRIRQLRLQ